MERIAELAKECNKLNKEYAEACYKRVMNIIVTEDGRYHEIDTPTVMAEYESAKSALISKMKELDNAIEESRDEKTTEHEVNTVQD